MKYLLTLTVNENGKDHGFKLLFNSKENAIERAEEYYHNSVGPDMIKKVLKATGDIVYNATIENHDDTITIKVEELDVEDAEESATYEVEIQKVISTTVYVDAASQEDANQIVQEAIEDDEYAFADEFFDGYDDTDFYDSGWEVVDNEN